MASFLRNRESRARGLGLASISTAACCVLFGIVSAAAVAAALSLKAKPRVIFYLHPAASSTKLKGRVASGRRGVRVALEARQWPFKSAFKRVARQRTRRDGHFSFKARPSLATRYRVVGPKGTGSRVRTVYVTAGYTNVSCSLTGPGGSHPCSGQSPRAGKYTVHFTFDFLYPASTFGAERGLPVYVYFAERFGSQQRPSTEALQGTVPQHPNGSTSTRVSITHDVVVPVAQAWAFSIGGCTQTQEQADGLGLPGKPGSHHCGAATISRQLLTHGHTG